MAKEIAYSRPGDKMMILRPNALFAVGKTETSCICLCTISRFVREY
jgi:hypothetical protein